MIRCREWKDHIRQPFPTLLRSIAHITGEPRIDGLMEALEKPLKGGKVLLLVDGLDEIHDDGDRTVFVENLEKFLSSYPKIRLMVTSREAGFDLVAPCLVRFCSKFKIAPLNVEAIRSLSDHWHRLMSGGTNEAEAEAQSVADALIGNEALRRLAENPLLLTMLLVVKHGAGRLPPDRVSLYDRAIEVLLDTWNIKGHEALNAKEALPQLACLAFELMKRGVQTATERDILEILEEARAKLPMVGRYAKDSPHDFLKRVELRSSLLVEGGHTTEGGQTVPFYQFRHLTFQEYLAAVAAVNGYTLSSDDPMSLVATIGDNLLADEWKEVVPMAAVLARMQTDDLLGVLVTEAERESDQYRALDAKERDRSRIADKPPPAVSRLMQAMVEEAAFSPSILQKTASVLTLFTQFQRAQDNLHILGRGPYGPDLRAAALDHYMNETFFHRSWARSTIAVLESAERKKSFWRDEASEVELLDQIANNDAREKVSAILTIGGGFLLHRDAIAAADSLPIYEALENSIFDKSRPVHQAAIWSWGFWRHLQRSSNRQCPKPKPAVLTRIIELFLENYGNPDNDVDYVIRQIADIPRDECNVVLSKANRDAFRKIYENADREMPTRITNRYAIIRTAFMLPDMYPDPELAAFIEKSRLPEFEKEGISDILIALGLEKRKSQGRSSKLPSASTRLDTE